MFGECFQKQFFVFENKNTQNVFDKRVFFVPMYSSCFLKSGFQKTKKCCFPCFCQCSKKKKNKMFFVFSINVLECSHLFTVKENSLLYEGKSENGKIKKSVKQKFNQKLNIIQQFFFFFLVISISIFFGYFKIYPHMIF